jgi:hypothetical protein
MIDAKMLEQIGVSAGAVKNYPLVFLVNAVYQKPVRFNMASPSLKAAIVSALKLPTVTDTGIGLER